MFIEIAHLLPPSARPLLGAKFENGKAMGENFKKWFSQLAFLSGDKVAVPSFRVRALMKDLLELKARGWVRNTTISRNPLILHPLLQEGAHTS